MKVDVKTLMHKTKSNRSIRQKAGVVAYRYKNENEVEILLITARSSPSTWIFPVGTVKSGESLQETAARECLEESGYVVDLVVYWKWLKLRKMIWFGNLLSF